MRASAYIDEKKLEEALRKECRQMQTKGLLPNIDENQLVHQAMATIKNGMGESFEFNMTNANKSFTNALSLILMTEYIKTKEPTFKFDYVKLFKDIPNLSDVEKKTLQKDLEKELREQLTKINKLLPKDQQKKPEEIDLMARLVAEGLVKKADQEMVKDQEKTSFFTLLVGLTPMPDMGKDEAKDLSYRSQYAGMDPSQTGSIPMLIQRIEENHVDFMNFTQGLATSFAEMDEQIRFDSNVPDYTGNEFSSLLKQLSIGGVNEQVEQELISDGVLKPMTPQNKP